MTRKAVFLYDYTGLMAQPWLDSGCECWCFDGQHPLGITREGNLVKVGMWFNHDQINKHATDILNMVGEGVVIVFGFPDCTDLTNAGSGHWKKKRRINPDFQNEAMKLCDLVRIVGELFNCPYAFENPVGVLSGIYRKPDFYFNPCDYSGYLPVTDVHPVYPDIYPPRDLYNKKTCIWSGNGFVEPHKKPLSPLFKENPGWKKCGGKSLKTKNIRSATPRGFALAVYESNRGES